MGSGVVLLGLEQCRVDVENVGDGLGDCGSRALLHGGHLLFQLGDETVLHVLASLLHCVQSSVRASKADLDDREVGGNTRKADGGENELKHGCKNYETTDQ